MNWVVRGIFSGLIVVILVGCNPPDNGVPVKGRVTENGTALKVPGGLAPGQKSVLVCFWALTNGQPGEPYFALLEEDGSFTVPGPKNSGIPPGQYRISVEAVRTGSAPAVPPPGASSDPPAVGGLGGSDRFNGTFGKVKSPFQVEVTGPLNVLIDVGGKGKLTVQ
jgi:hypothetical protein